MKISNNMGNPVPTAHLTVNKNRVKIYDNNNYYLKNGQTFEIELFNPTKDKIKADIELDGEIVSGGGIVLRPGERLHLERFVDTNNKFLYETYEVEDSEEVRDAISNNGSLKVRFYENSYHLYKLNYPTAHTTTFTTTFCPDVGISFTAPENYGAYTTNIDSDGNMSCISDDTLYGSMEDMVLKQSNNLETGRTEKGEASDQHFTTTYDTFNTIPFNEVEYKISPVSQQPITKETLVNVKRYCTNCGSKIKTSSSWKFCPQCGEKV